MTDASTEAHSEHCDRLKAWSKFLEVEGCWGYYQDVDDAVAAYRGLIAERDALKAKVDLQSYTYLGKDGKPVLARDLEDERDALRAQLLQNRKVTTSKL